MKLADYWHSIKEVCSKCGKPVHFSKDYPYKKNGIFGPKFFCKSCWDKEKSEGS